MQDRLNARLTRQEPTGNGRRESYAHPPLPRMTNTFMLAGEDDPADIIRSVDHGLYAVNFGGGQVDITSGKFVFSASEAYLIEGGRVTAPVKGATLIGNGPDALTRVSRVGSDLALDEGVGTCGKDGPVGAGRRGAARPSASTASRWEAPRFERRLARPPRRRPRAGARQGRHRSGCLRGRGSVVLGAGTHGAGGHGQARPRSASRLARLRGPLLRRRVHVGSLARFAGPPGGRGGHPRAHHCARPPVGPRRPRRPGARGCRDLDLDDPRGHDLTPEDKIDLARRCEAAALAFDARITNSEGGDFADGHARYAYATSPRLRGRLPLLVVQPVDLAARRGERRDAARRLVPRDAQAGASWTRRRPSAAPPPSAPCAGWARDG